MVHLLDQPLGMLHLGHQTLGMLHVVHVLMLHILHLLLLLMLHLVHLRKQGLVMCHQDMCHQDMWSYHTNLLFHSPRPPTACTLSPPFRHGLLKVMSRRAKRGVRA